MGLAFVPTEPPPDGGWDVLIAEWLAGLFIAPPTAATVANYRNGLGASFFDTLAETPACRPGVQRMRATLLTNDPPAVVARTLSVAFTLLFDGVGGGMSVAPYESAHVGDGGRLFQQPVSDMDRLLRLSEMSPARTFREPADHLSIELSLLAHLLRHEASHRAGVTLPTLLALLDDHLLVWVPIFADRCSVADGTGFYAGAAQVLAGFLRARRAALRTRRSRLPARAMAKTGRANKGEATWRSE